MRKSRVLEKLKHGEYCKCFKVNLSDPRVVEICGLSGLDAIWLCGEHVANDWLNLENQIRAAELHNMDTFVRVSKGSYSEYIKPLELGATGIIVPNVRNGTEIRELIQMTRFFPLGKRPIDGGNRDGKFASVPVLEYIQNSNTNTCVVVQIESPEGIENIDTIASTEGFEFLFFGPSDYCHQIGHPGEFNHPDMLAAKKIVEEAALKYGKFLFSVLDRPDDHELTKRKVFVTGADVLCLNEAIRERSRIFETTGNGPYGSKG